ncbi:MAG: hypothetical protein KC621_00795 [Myxococcales bacterium]|nr:hypothetical protein [Myxococcales bacterium]
MLPDTELLCELRDGLTLCDANQWHTVFVVQTLIVCSLGLVNVGLGLRHLFGRLDVPLWVARRFALATALSAVVPLSTGLWLREQVREASYACYLQHATNGCTHSLVDRGHEMAGILHWVGWTEALLLSTCVVSLGLLFGRAERR